eukprot:1375523-Amphidinium_carterae.4
MDSITSQSPMGDLRSSDHSESWMSRKPSYITYEEAKEAGTPVKRARWSTWRSVRAAPVLSDPRIHQF